MNKTRLTRIPALTLGLLTGLAAATSTLAHDIDANPGYWSTPDGTVLRTGFGECWRTIEWTPALSIPECEGGRSAVKAPASAPLSAAEPAPVPAATVAEPAAAEPAPAAESVATSPAVIAPAASAAPTAAVAAAPEPVAAAQPEPAPGFETISLSGAALFASGQDQLRNDDVAELDELAATMRRYPDIEQIEVVGHTDSRGAAAFNQALSERRAEAVRDYLVRRGVAAERITTLGMGPRQPIASNDTAAGRAQNRRVEIRVTATRQVR